MRLCICLPVLSLLVLVIVTALVVKVSARENAPMRVIADVDTGIDDIEALVFLCDADKRGVLKLEAIVVTEGNTDHVHGVRNVFLLLKVLNRLDIPVYLGGKQALLQHDTKMGGYYGADGLGNLSWKTSAPVHLLRRQRAYEAIKDLVLRHPNDITYMTLGPMTTLGMTIWQYPEVAEQLKAVYSMGGLEYLGGGEFNVAFDPEAVDIVFRSLGLQKAKMLMVTWQAGETNSPKTNWYKNITTVSNPAWRFMTRIQDAINTLLFGDDPSVLGNASWDHCDPIVPAVFLNPSLIKASFTSPLKIEVGRDAARGIITNGTVGTLTTVAVQVVEEIDYDAMLVDFVAAFKGVCEGKCTEVN